LKDTDSLKPVVAGIHSRTSILELNILLVHQVDKQLKRMLGNRRPWRRMRWSSWRPMNSSAARRFSTVNPQRIPSDAAASVDVSALDAVYRTLLDVSNPDERIQLTPAQTVAVDCATRGFSVFLHLPTGAGKSLAFQAPALVAPPGKTTLVVSPLIALMHVRTAQSTFLILEATPCLLQLYA
jgi:hypothetical protein